MEQRNMVDVIYDIATRGHSGLTRHPDSKKACSFGVVMWEALVSPVGTEPQQVVILDGQDNVLFIDHQYPQDANAPWTSGENIVGCRLHEVGRRFRKIVECQPIVTIVYENGDRETYVRKPNAWWFHHSSYRVADIVSPGTTFNAYEGIREDVFAEFYKTKAAGVKRHREFDTAMKVAIKRWNNRASNS